MDAPAMEMISALEAEQETPEMGPYHAVIAAAFAGQYGRLDVRHLWTRGGVSFFRANWWSRDWISGEDHVRRSEFVAVEMTDAGLRLQTHTWRRAA